MAPTAGCRSPRTQVLSAIYTAAALAGMDTLSSTDDLGPDAVSSMARSCGGKVCMQVFVCACVCVCVRVCGGGGGAKGNGGACARVGATNNQQVPPRPSPHYSLHLCGIQVSGPKVGPKVGAAMAERRR